MNALSKSSEPSMEEILASIRRIIADDQQATLATPEPANAPAPPAVLDLAVEAKPAPPPPAKVEPEPEPEPQGQDDIDLLFLEPEPQPPAPPPVPVAPPPPPVAAAPVPAIEDTALMSAATSASIAGAFSSLSNTLLTANARTLEDLVKDMMKPMLKGWLDDNLPSIVERLVRAEIERVARGGR